MRGDSMPGVEERTTGEPGRVILLVMAVLVVLMVIGVLRDVSRRSNKRASISLSPSSTVAAAAAAVSGAVAPRAADRPRTGIHPRSGYRHRRGLLLIPLSAKPGERARSRRPEQALGAEERRQPGSDQNDFQSHGHSIRSSSTLTAWHGCVPTSESP